MSVSGGWSGLPDHPRRPLNVRPRIVSAGRKEKCRTATPWFQGCVLGTVLPLRVEWRNITVPAERHGSPAGGQRSALEIRDQGGMVGRSFTTPLQVIDPRHAEPLGEPGVSGQQVDA